MTIIKKKKIFNFLRNKGETSVITTPYDKFLNLFLKKDLKIKV